MDVHNVKFLLSMQKMDIEEKGEKKETERGKRNKIPYIYEHTRNEDN